MNLRLKRIEAPIHQIKLKTTLHDIESNVECVICGHETEKDYLDYKLGRITVFYAEKAAGYRCLNGCGIGFLSHEAVIEALDIVESVLTQSGRSDEAAVYKDASELEGRLLAEA